jgi:hypothetical protein
MMLEEENLDKFDLNQEVLVVCPEHESFEIDWIKNRKQGGDESHIANVLGPHSEDLLVLDWRYNEQVENNTQNYLTFVGHSVVNAGDENTNLNRGYYALPDEEVIQCIVVLRKAYPKIDTINFFTCWSAALAPSNPEGKPESLEQRQVETGYNLTFCERMIVRLAEKKGKNYLENLTVVGCMGLVAYNRSGRTQVSREIREGSDKDTYAKYVGGFASINAGGFIKEYGTLIGEEYVNKQKSDTESSTDSDDDRPLPLSNRFQLFSSKKTSNIPSDDSMNSQEFNQNFS